MTVYVDQLRNTAPSRAWPFTMAAHMLADSVDELHAFATRLGMKRAWFQRGSTPHYDLTASRHKLALELGAVRLDRRQLVALVRRLRSQPPQKGQFDVTDQRSEGTATDP